MQDLQSLQIIISCNYLRPSTIKEIIDDLKDDYEQECDLIFKGQIGEMIIHLQQSLIDYGAC